MVPFLTSDGPLYLVLLFVTHLDPLVGLVRNHGLHMVCSLDWTPGSVRSEGRDGLFGR